MTTSMAFIAALPLVYALAAAPASGDTAAVVKGNNRFGFDLYHRLNGGSGNLFLSPYSISTALAMTEAGAKGQTAEQMRHVLHLPSDAEAQAGLTHLMKELNAGGAKKAYQLSVANALWGASNYPFRPDYLKRVKDNFGAELTNLDFAANPDGARHTINGWVEKETNDKIKDLIGPGVLGARTRLVLTNAIYFKGMWERPFKKEQTKDEPFRTSTGAQPKVPLMHQTARLLYAEADGLQALEMPYAGKDLAMLVLLPHKDDLSGLESKLSPEFLDAVSSKLEWQEVIVSLPRFKTTAQFELSHELSSMGMGLAFSGQGDFSGMTTATEPLQISEVIHKAFVDVNEEGTEAAAATAVTVRAAAIARPKPLPVFRADHPFVYLIRDVRNGSVLFLGRMTDPTK
jgi:serpin B